MKSRLRAAILAALLILPGLAEAIRRPEPGTPTRGGQSVEITLSPDGAFARRDSGPAGTEMTVLPAAERWEAPVHGCG